MSNLQFFKGIKNVKGKLAPTVCSAALAMAMFPVYGCAIENTTIKDEAAETSQEIENSPAESPNIVDFPQDGNREILPKGYQEYKDVYTYEKVYNIAFHLYRSGLHLYHSGLAVGVLIGAAGGYGYAKYRKH